jgi:dienelactone hydrolase
MSAKEPNPDMDSLSLALISMLRVSALFSDDIPVSALIRNFSRIVLIAAALVAVQPDAASATNFLFQDTQVQAKYPQAAGSPTWSLEAVVVRADDNQRHPLAAFIDGTPESNPRPMLYVARELARRGWTTVAVMRPGYGTSQGKEPPSQCGNYVSQANFAAQTLRETIRTIGALSYIDPSRSIAVGHSTGGLGAVATTVNPPDTLVAGISFAGNNGSQYLNGKLDTVCDSADVIKAFATFGAGSKIPMLWIYAQNDHHMGPALAQEYYKAFSGAGGKADFEMAPATADGTDGHMLYSMADEVPVWTPYLDKFFADQHLALVSPPLTITVPDVAVPEALGPSGRTGFATYLAAMPHKAFAMSRSYWGSAWLFDSTDEAVKKAMANCKGTVADPCKIVMIDDQLNP